MKRSFIAKKGFTAVIIICVCMLIALTLPIGAASANQPESYDARDYGLVTSVKSQGPFGTCWAHAVCAVAETNMIKKGLADINTDYSELHLAYFTFQRTDDPLGNYEDEGAYLVGNAANYTFMSAGGDPGIAGFTLMRGTGLVDEAVVPYSSADEVLANGLDPSLAYSNVAARLTDIYYISFSQPDRIKQAILDNGAVCTTLNDASLSTSPVFFNKETGAYYKNDPNAGSAHSVAIIGWDDNYAVENFTAGNRPSSAGAWLIKDSAGTDWGVDGYWWASYEDVDFNLTTTKNVAVMIFDKPEVFERTYQYDGSSRNSSYSADSSSIYLANVYTAQENEVITSVSVCLNYAKNRPYTVEIYTGLGKQGYFSPTEGTLAATLTAYSRGGYVTLPVGSPIELIKGEKFSVVVSYEGADEDGRIWMDYDVEKNDGYFAYSVSAEKGQSYYTVDPVNFAWTDLADVSYFGKANFRIKAHTRLTSAPPQEDTYTLTVSGGSDLTGGSPYVAGAAVTVKADTAPDGMRFKEWQTTGGTLADKTAVQTTLVMPAANVTLTAVFEQIPVMKYSLTVNGGSDLTGGSPYVAGASVTVKADAAPNGMRFKEWQTTGGTLADKNSAQTTLVMPAANVTLTSVYEQIPVMKYTLTVNGGSDLTGGSPYVAGASVTVKADTAPDGMRFKEWQTTGGTLADKTAAQTTLVMPAANVTLTSVYEQMPVVEEKCVHIVKSDTASGKLMLVIGGYVIGADGSRFIYTPFTNAAALAELADGYYWNFSGSGSDIRIKSNGGLYLSCSGTTPVLSSSAKGWKYSGGKFSYQTTTGRFYKKTTTYYLGCNGSLTVSTSSSAAASELYTVEVHVSHSYKTIRVEPTCQKEGYEAVACEYCGEQLSYTVLPTVDHSYGANHTWEPRNIEVPDSFFATQ